MIGTSMKKGFTLMECMISAIIVSILAIASVPFISSIIDKQNDNLERQASTISELSNINKVESALSYNELLRYDFDSISIEKVNGTSRLYKITGNTTGVEVYWVDKQGE